jgi:FKBP-type peptidyl-prolyl cis-trans isomerase
MRKLTFNEWVAVVIAVAVVSYFFFFNGKFFSFSTGESSLASVNNPIEVRNTTNASTTEIMAENTYSLPGIQVADVVVGSGEEAIAGKTVIVNYTGMLQDGTVFDSSIPRGVPFDFVLGAGDVIKGWDEGVAGMKVGGKRVLVIAPEKAYGNMAVGSIPPNSTLIFEVELLDVQ